jgi:hypothetical protein
MVCVPKYEWHDPGRPSFETRALTSEFAEPLRSARPQDEAELTIAVRSYQLDAALVSCAPASRSTNQCRPVSR